MRKPSWLSCIQGTIRTTYSIAPACLASHTSSRPSSHIPCLSPSHSPSHPHKLLHAQTNRIHTSTCTICIHRGTSSHKTYIDQWPARRLQICKQRAAARNVFFLRFPATDAFMQMHKRMRMDLCRHVQLHAPTRLHTKMKTCKAIGSELYQIHRNRIFKYKLT